MVWFREYLDAWGSGDVAAVTAFVTDDVDFEDVGAGHHLQGIERMAKFVAKSFELVPGSTFELVGGHELGEHYHYEWVMQPFGLRCVSIGRRRDGRIAEQRDYWNRTQLDLQKPTDAGTD